MGLSGIGGRPDQRRRCDFDRMGPVPPCLQVSGNLESWNWEALVMAEGDVTGNGKLGGVWDAVDWPSGNQSRPLRC